MGEHTVGELVACLRHLGLAPGDAVLVHGSLRGVGRVAGGGAGVLEALRRAVGASARASRADTHGTVVVPAFTPGNSDSSAAFRTATAGMTPARVAAYRAAMPAFDPDRTPAHPGMGALSELVRNAPDGRRSAHPQTSFAAVGRLADAVTLGHDPTCHLGERSPLRRLYDLGGAHVLLLGTGFPVFSAFHLAEYRVPDPPSRIYRCVVPGPNGGPVWWSYTDVVLDDSDFGALGAAYAAACPPRAGRVGAADALLVPLVPAVDFAVGWLAAHRSGSSRPPGAK
ncbi:AAC(3) family N-acetyltransferase [Yinghuangia sp. ASG 101]|uniref:aminoglycoside N(3)-acetyltransferase n=1 Tax=Yinghuangia sp. ASG 101 TaxID=2896848 RepID=UPI001E3920B2|nr:AAC(3) family N-acetyltransferase [Yinghuangia sp. ASG 101]UGQ09683.1 AAC(3) family N-acetyltransferase [Yinghuangia sp. ASG 101]